MLYTAKVAVYSVIGIKHIWHSVGRTQNFFMLNVVVHMVTTRFEKVKPVYYEYLHQLCYTAPPSQNEVLISYVKVLIPSSFNAFNSHFQNGQSNSVVPC
jgi:hypothetical protein